ncbi:MAG: hypothetical protein IPO26_20100 [Saprospiraceae bacterium]|nr:hypothetical protein [Saprospiraceae bacterium]
MEQALIHLPCGILDFASIGFDGDDSTETRIFQALITDLVTIGFLAMIAYLNIFVLFPKSERP